MVSLYESAFSFLGKITQYQQFRGTELYLAPSFHPHTIRSVLYHTLSDFQANQVHNPVLSRFGTHSDGEGSQGCFCIELFTHDLHAFLSVHCIVTLRISFENEANNRAPTM